MFKKSKMENYKFQFKNQFFKWIFLVSDGFDIETPNYEILPHRNIVCWKREVRVFIYTIQYFLFPKVVKTL